MILIKTFKELQNVVEILVLRISLLYFAVEMLPHTSAFFEDQGVTMKLIGQNNLTAIKPFASLTFCSTIVCRAALLQVFKVF